MTKPTSPLYVTVVLRLDGPYGVPERVARDVLADMEENYMTDLQLSEPDVIGVSEQRPRRVA